MRTDEGNISSWLKDEIVSFVQSSPENSLRAKRGEKAWETPLVGFSCGTDPLYQTIKKQIDGFYWTPINIFYHTFPDLPVEFDKVNDVSISGMGLVVDHSLDENSPLQVSYESDDLNILVNAKIIWQENAGASSFRIGVEYSNENVDSNVMLFMAMREYIDDFGESF